MAIECPDLRLNKSEAYTFSMGVRTQKTVRFGPPVAIENECSALCQYHDILIK